MLEITGFNRLWIVIIIYIRAKYRMLVLYHGTNKENGKKIIASKVFKRSFGNEHWLGDGIYFYEEKFYAFRWIYIAYNRKYPQSKPEIHNITDKYVILSANITINQERIFDMSRYEHKIMFDRVLRKSIEKNKDKNLRIVDGAVFNFMFYKMNYNKKFDMIKAIFMHEDNDILDSSTRLPYIPEIQYCVVNSLIISNIGNTNISDEEIPMLSFSQHYNDNGNGRLIKYKPRKNMYNN